MPRPQRGVRSIRPSTSVLSDAGGPQSAKMPERLGPRCNGAHGELSEAEGMQDDAILTQQCREPRAGVAPVVYPHGRVCQDVHRLRVLLCGPMGVGGNRRRGGAFAWGIVPPKAASRRADSRETK